jgi:hypothetical protein
MESPRSVHSAFHIPNHDYPNAVPSRRHASRTGSKPVGSQAVRGLRRTLLPRVPSGCGGGRRWGGIRESFTPISPFPHPGGRTCIWLRLKPEGFDHPRREQEVPYLDNHVPNSAFTIHRSDGAGGVCGRRSLGSGPRQCSRALRRRSQRGFSLGGENGGARIPGPVVRMVPLC